jgi:hypothetical protein
VYLEFVYDIIKIMKKKTKIQIEEIRENVNRHPGRMLTINEAELHMSAGFYVEVYVSYNNKWIIINSNNYSRSPYNEYFRVPEVENECIRDLQDDIRELREQIKILQEYNEQIFSNW